LDLIKIGCPQFPAYWLKIRLWLPNFCLGEDDSPLKSWIYPECVSYRSATLRRVAAGAGLRFEVLDWKHPRQTWALFAAPKFDSDRFKNKPLTWNIGLENVLRQKKKENLAAAANAGSIRRNG
jgi:hypothetical protein